MKRLLCLLVCLSLLLPAFAVTAFASTNYVFYPYEPVAFYGGDFDFSAVPVNASWYVLDGILPEGHYSISIVGEKFDKPALAVIDEFYFDGIEYEGIVTGQFYVDGSYYYDEYFPVHIFVDDDVTLLIVDFTALSTDNTEFPLVEFTVNADLSLSNFLSGDILQGVLDYIWVLIPVTLSVLVGYVGIRKGIFWLMRILRSS